MGKFFTGVVLAIFVFFGVLIFTVLDKHQEMQKQKMESCASKGGILIKDTSQGSVKTFWCVKKEAFL